MLVPMQTKWLLALKINISLIARCTLYKFM